MSMMHLLGSIILSSVFTVVFSVGVSQKDLPEYEEYADALARVIQENSLPRAIDDLDNIRGILVDTSVSNQNRDNTKFYKHTDVNELQTLITKSLKNSKLTLNVPSSIHVFRDESSVGHVPASEYLERHNNFMSQRSQNTGYPKKDRSRSRSGLSKSITTYGSDRYASKYAGQGRMTQVFPKGLGGEQYDVIMRSNSLTDNRNIGYSILAGSVPRRYGSQRTKILRAIFVGSRLGEQIPSFTLGNQYLNKIIDSQGRRNTEGRVRPRYYTRRRKQVKEYAPPNYATHEIEEMIEKSQMSRKDEKRGNTIIKGGKGGLVGRIRQKSDNR